MKNYPKEKEWLLREKYNGQETEEFFKDVKHLESGEPIDYLIGFFDFLDCKIDLSSRPLIPRTETEWWVEKAIKNFGHPMSEIFILDIFAGSGCIGIALLKHLPTATVDFGEKKLNFILQTEKNIALNGIDPKRTQIFTSDIFENIPQKKYDFIFANPPYISPEKIEAVQKSVLDHEPNSAIFAEDNGLFYIKKLLTEAPQFLASGGKLFVEFDSWQKEKIEKLITLSPFQAKFWKDQFDRWRVVVCSLK